MDKHEITEIMACLPQEKTHYRYFKDYFALQLLSYLADEQALSIDQLRHTPFARLLHKPVMRPLLAMCGDGLINPWRINAQWQEPSLPFLLTIGTWGGEDWDWQQTSRPGYNLVLRLNFTRAHDSRFEKLLRPLHYDTFNEYSHCHPVLQADERPYFRETLAWARLDIDMEQGEVLIEEIQTDWVREAMEALEKRQPCKAHKASEDPHCNACKASRSLHQYMNAVLKPYARVWDQAMLSAAIFFIRKELGIHNIFYHTWNSGNAFKNLHSDAYKPPRSLYTQLPKQFCFQPSSAVPQFLRGRKAQKRLRKHAISPCFYQLQV